MYEIIYSSTASRDLNNDDITDILTTAHKYNAINKITGCLLYHNREFIQILEGEKEKVESLFSVIYQDDRHTDVILLAEGEKEERVFNDFSMAYHELSDDDVQGMSKELFVSNFIAFSEVVDKPTFPMMLFWSLAKQLLTK